MTTTSETAAPTRGPLVRRPRRGAKLGSKLVPLLWLAPSLILMFAVILYPVIEMVRSSLSIINISGENIGFAGFSNYTALFHEQDLGKVVSNTVIWVVVVVIITMVASMALASC